MAELSSNVLGIAAKLLLNPQHLVVLGQPLRAAWSTSLDLASAETNNQVGNEAVLCLARAVADHGAPAIGLSQVVRSNGLSHRSNLVDLQKEAIAGLLVHGHLDALGVGDSQVITHNLDVSGSSKLRPALPVILQIGDREM